MLFNFKNFNPNAIPTAIGKIPVTIADEYTLNSGKFNAMDLPDKISSVNLFSGTFFNKQW